MGVDERSDLGFPVAQGTLNFGAIWRHLAYPPSFVALEFRNWLKYSNAVGRVHTGDDPSTSGKKFGELPSSK